MIHLTNEEYDKLLREIDEKTEYIALYAKEKNEQKQRADEYEKRWNKLKYHFIKQKGNPYSLLHWSRCNGILELMEEIEGDDE